MSDVTALPSSVSPQKAVLTWNDLKQELASLIPIAWMFGDSVARETNGPLEKNRGEVRNTQENKRIRNSSSDVMGETPL